MAGNFNCVLNEAQFELEFPKQVGRQPTFGLVTDQADWEVKRNDPAFLAPGMQPGIGDLRQFKRKVFVAGKLVMPDGVEIRHWGFEDENGVKDFPSTPIRVTAGDLVQVDLSTAKNRHTIHHHGIEPDMDNDGVGHTSFEVLGHYIYQWRPHTANAGTFFYHCHVNTTLHVQMGLFGALIVDPFDPEPKGPGRLPFGDAKEEWRYNPAFERIWVPYSIDPRWHTLHHLAGFCGEDAGLNEFNPKYFLLGRHPQHPDGRPILGDAKQPVALTMPVNETAYIRLIQSTYHPVRVDLGALGDFTQLVESDGRAIRTGVSLNGLGLGGDPISIPWNDWRVDDKELSPAERYGLIVKPTRPGVFPVEFAFHHWVSGEKLGHMRTQVTVV